MEITWLLPLHNGRRYDYFKIISRVAFIVPVYANTSHKEKFLLIIQLNPGKLCYVNNEIPFKKFSIFELLDFTATCGNAKCVTELKYKLHELNNQNDLGNAST